MGRDRLELMSSSTYPHPLSQVKSRHHSLLISRTKVLLTLCMYIQNYNYGNHKKDEKQFNSQSVTYEIRDVAFLNLQLRHTHTYKYIQAS